MRLHATDDPAGRTKWSFVILTARAVTGTLPGLVTARTIKP